MRMTTLRVLILGDHKVGKSAVTVRFLTKRFIGEYYSSVDHLYRSCVRHEDTLTDVEVLDTCSKKCPSNVEEGQVNWADAFVIVYSICNKVSFTTAQHLILTVSNARSSSYFPLLLLGNMADLEHRREVGVEEGHQVALAHGCQYYEVSAADSAISVNIAFEAFLREARLAQQRRSTLLRRRRGSLGSVSRKLGAMFGKNSASKEHNGDSDKRKSSLTHGIRDFGSDWDKMKLSSNGKDLSGDWDGRKTSLTLDHKDCSGKWDRRKSSLTIDHKDCSGKWDRRKWSLSDDNTDSARELDRRKLCETRGSDCWRRKTSEDIMDKKS